MNSSHETAKKLIIIFYLILENKNNYTLYITDFISGKQTYDLAPRSTTITVEV